MQKKTTLLFGVTLILLGVLVLAGNLLLQRTGSGSLSAHRAWPVFVVGAGLLFCLPPFIFSEQRGLSGLFIPGIPAFATGILLFIASQTGNWHLWASFWPVEVISVAAGFVLMAIFLRNPMADDPGFHHRIHGIRASILCPHRSVGCLGSSLVRGTVRRWSPIAHHRHG